MRAQGNSTWSVSALVVPSTQFTEQRETEKLFPMLRAELKNFPDRKVLPRTSDEKKFSKNFPFDFLSVDGKVFEPREVNQWFGDNIWQVIDLIETQLEFEFNSQVKQFWEEKKSIKFLCSESASSRCLLLLLLSLNLMWIKRLPKRLPSFRTFLRKTINNPSRFSSNCISSCGSWKFSCASQVKFDFRISYGTRQKPVFGCLHCMLRSEKSKWPKRQTHSLFFRFSAFSMQTNSK